MPKTDCAIKCANCAHFKPDESKCRRFPPVMLVTEDGACWEFPDVLPEEYCGEFGAKQ